jgi:hypothetical protein
VCTRLSDRRHFIYISLSMADYSAIIYCSCEADRILSRARFNLEADPSCIVTLSVVAQLPSWLISLRLAIHLHLMEIRWLKGTSNVTPMCMCDKVPMTHSLEHLSQPDPPAGPLSFPFSRLCPAKRFSLPDNHRNGLWAAFSDLLITFPFTRSLLRHGCSPCEFLFSPCLSLAVQTTTVENRTTSSPTPLFITCEAGPLIVVQRLVTVSF